MAGTRRSTRISNANAAAKPESDDTKEAPAAETVQQKSAARPTARRKRALDDDPGDGDGDSLQKSAKKQAVETPTKPTTKKKAANAKRTAKDTNGVANRTCSPKPPKPAADIASKTPANPPTRPSVADSASPTTDKPTKQEVFWLLKAEPETRIENEVDVKFSIDDLAACTEPEPWTGVRNYQARNNMMAMKEGDLAFFYHSNAKPSGVVGVMKIVKEATVDESAFDPKDPYYDPKSSRDKPKWFNVHVEFVRKFPNIIDLQTLKGHAAPGGPLEGIQLVTASRLSVSRVTKKEWDFIMDLAEGID